MDEEVRPWKLCTIVEDDRSEEPATINLHFNNNFVGGNSIFASSIPFGECPSTMALHLTSCNGNLKYPIIVTFNECGGNEIETFPQVYKRNEDKGSLKLITGKPTELFNKDNGPVLNLAYFMISQVIYDIFGTYGFFIGTLRN